MDTDRLILQLNEVIQVWTDEANAMDVGRRELVLDVLVDLRNAIETS
jgi:hypothetical protein